MANAWTQHVQNYRQQHPGMSYKDALKMAASTYQPVSGGKFSMKGAMKSAKAGLKQGQAAVTQGQQLMEQNAHLVSAFDNQFGTKVGKTVARGNKLANQGQAIAAQAQEMTGGKFVLKNAIRKTKNTAKRVGKVSNNVLDQVERYAPLVEGVVPFGAQIQSGLSAARMVADATGGSFRTHGGSFKVQGGCMHCRSCGSVSGGAMMAPVNSALLPSLHHAMNPVKTKPMYKSIYEN